MEFQTYGNPDCIVYEPYMGVCYRSTTDAIDKIQHELNDRLKFDNHFTLKEMYEILTADWPEDKKEEFWQRYYKGIGWMTNGNELDNYAYIQRKSLDKDGNLVILFDLEPKWNENEEPE